MKILRKTMFFVMASASLLPASGFCKSERIVISGTYAEDNQNEQYYTAGIRFYAKAHKEAGKCNNATLRSEMHLIFNAHRGYFSYSYKNNAINAYNCWVALTRLANKYNEIPNNWDSIDYNLKRSIANFEIYDKR